MDWDKKVQMTALLNQGRYEEAASYYYGNEDWDNPDPQALDMFCNGFDLTEHQFCDILADKFTSEKVRSESVYGKMSFRSQFRFHMLNSMMGIE